MANASTHSGHCQACGSLQKLPGGLLSLHGYKVTYGFFSGTCQGSKEQPIETSCNLIKRFITKAQASLVALEAFQAKLRQPATTARAWVRNYEGRVYGRNKHVWIEVELRADDLEKGGRTLRFGYVANGTNGSVNQVHEIPDYTYGKQTLLDLATKENTTYAAWLEHEADSLRRYIAWQKNRVATWKPAPLLPHDAKDKASAFKPTEAKY